MASIRIGFSSDFILKNGVVGLGTTVGSTTDGKLELDNGALRANLSVSGVATLTAYGGFVAQRQYVNKPAAIGFATVGVGTFQQYYETTTEFTDLGGVHHGDDQRFNTLSEDLIIDDGQILNITNTEMVGFTTIGEYDPHSHSSYVCAGSLEQVSITGHFSVPSGGINDRQSFIEGTVRFNTDLNTLEFFNGSEWRQFTYNQGQSGRGVFMGGFDKILPNPSFTTEISYINILSLGNTQGFGDVTPNVGGGNAGLGNATRGLVGGGFNPGYTDTIEYITIASEGDSIDFGNLTDARRYASGASSSTRGIFGGGYSPGVVNVIDYVEISTVGNALNFGDLSEEGEALGTATSPTRACFAGGRHPQTDEFIDYITMASTGDAIDFGDLSQARQNMCYHTSSSSTRGIFAGGINPSQVNTIDYITIAATGNATDFGDLTENRRLAFNVSTQTRAVFAGGYNNVQSMDYVTIASAANATDFGDMVGKRRFSGGACSDSHGGLGGF